MILFNQHKIYFFNLKFIDKKHWTYQSKTVPLQISLIQAPRSKQRQECSYLACSNYLSEITWWFHYGEFFNQTRWIKPMKLKVQTWLTKQNSKVSTKQPKLFFLLAMRCSEKFQMEGATNWSKTTRNKRTARVLPSQNLK